MTDIARREWQCSIWEQQNVVIPTLQRLSFGLATQSNQQWQWTRQLTPVNAQPESAVLSAHIADISCWITFLFSVHIADLLCWIAFLQKIQVKRLTVSVVAFVVIVDSIAFWATDRCYSRLAMSVIYLATQSNQPWQQMWQLTPLKRTSWIRCTLCTHCRYIMLDHILILCTHCRPIMLANIIFNFAHITDTSLHAHIAGLSCWIIVWKLPQLTKPLFHDQTKDVI